MFPVAFLRVADPLAEMQDVADNDIGVPPTECVEEDSDNWVVVDVVVAANSKEFR